MKQILSKISYFTLALLVLFSTFSFTVDKHYCGEKVRIKSERSSGNCAQADRCRRDHIV